jgi:hypothetical protein
MLIPEAREPTARTVRECVDVLTHDVTEPEEAARAAVKGLDVATKALIVAQAEEGHSRELVAEAHRARLNAALPEISITARPTPNWPPFISDDNGKTWQRCSEDDVWHLPADEDKYLGVGFRVTILNGSEKRITLTVGPFTPTGKSPRDGDKFVLNPHSERYFDVMSWTTMRTWADVWSDTLETFGMGNFSSPFSVFYQDSLDNGVSISWHCKVSGSPIFEPSSTKKEQYRLSSTWDDARDLGGPRPVPPTVEQPREHRTYWISRAREVQVGAHSEA